jgi:hypothetical protein
MTTPVIYLAARYSRAEEMRHYRDQLTDLGYRVSSRWIDHHGGTLTESLGSDDISNNLEYAQTIAQTDLIDLDASHIVIAFTEEKGGGKGGRHFELGYAIARTKRIIIVGPRENIFHSLSFIQQHPTWEAFMEFARRINAASSCTTRGTEAPSTVSPTGEGSAAGN